MVSQNLLGIRATDLTPDLAGFDIGAFLGGLRMAPSIEVRHTVGLVDPITAGDQKPGERVNDGLPETLEEVVRHYRGRYYKLKVGGNVAADLERLAGIAAVLDRALPEYRATLDGNEQYESVEGIAELWRRMRETPALRRLVDGHHLFIEQPIKRQRGARRARSRRSADEKPVEIDESDGELSSFPAALALGYTGVSSKNCKGFYKSILNAARVAKLNAEAGGRAPSCRPRISPPGRASACSRISASSSLLGLTHVERNGHHFIDGMSFAPEAEQAAFVAAHPDLYAKGAGAGAAAHRGGAPLDRLARLSGLCRRGGDGLRLHAPDAGGAARAGRTRSGGGRMSALPERFESVAALEDFMTEPTPALVDDLARAPGDILILGVAGKMGPTLARLAKRAAPERSVIGVARFSDAAARRALDRAGVETIACDLLDRAAVEALPRAPNVVFMAGMKFGATGNEPLTWAMNVHVPAIVAETFARSRIVAFSTGCVYPFVPVASAGATEETPAIPPPGDYANSCLGRERMFAYFSGLHGTPGRIVPAELRDRHALRRAPRCRPQGARRRRDRRHDGPRQRDLAGRRQRRRAALPRACDDADDARSTSPVRRRSRCAGSPGSSAG